MNLYELIKQNQFRGLSTTLVRVFAQQLLNGLTLLNKARLIHCDLKPENILLKKYVAWKLLSPYILLIDITALKALSSRLLTLDRPAMRGKPYIHTSSQGSIARQKFY